MIDGFEWLQVHKNLHDFQSYAHNEIFKGCFSGAQELETLVATQFIWKVIFPKASLACTFVRFIMVSFLNILYAQKFINGLSSYCFALL